MISRLLWAAGQASKTLPAATYSSAAITAWQSAMSTPCSLRQAAAASSSTCIYGRLFKTFSTETASASGSNSQSILEKAAMARMQKLQAPQHDPQEDTPTSPFSRALGILADATLLGVAGLAVFGGYYTAAYRDTTDLDKALYEAKQTLKAAAPGTPSTPGTLAEPGASGAAGTPPPQSDQPLLSPSVSRPLTWAWCSVMERYLNARKYVEKSIRDYQNPTCDRLLPDLDRQLQGRVKTLVLDLNDLLVHKEWTRQSGWKVYKRPGVQDFLMEIGPYFEIVIFTDEQAHYAAPIIDKLDPNRFVQYRLYRPETQYHEGKHVRDLSKLNRDLSQVLMISSHPDAWAFQPDNALKLKPWVKDYTDTTLLDLIPMLQLIATMGVKDTRDVARAYDGEEDIPKAFKARMSQVVQQQQQKPKSRGLLSNFAK